MIHGTSSKLEYNTLLDTGATRSCINYRTAYQIGKGQIKPYNKLQVVGADGSDLGTSSKLEYNALLDTGATRSCINYRTAYQIGKGQIKPYNNLQVVGADGSDLGAVGKIKCNIKIGDTILQQSFIICKHL